MSASLPLRILTTGEWCGREVLEQGKRAALASGGVTTVRVLTVRPDAPLEAVEAALARVRAPRVALSFPAHPPAWVTDEPALQRLATFCGRLGKDVLVVGGDNHLRALAVAAGFAVATTLDDDESRPTRDVEGFPAEFWEQAEVAFTLQRGRATLPLRMDEDVSEELADEPPDYVRRLLRREGTYRGPRDEDLSAERRRTRITRPLEPLDDDELLRIENESHEDHVTHAIRRTGGLPSIPLRRASQNGGRRADSGAP